MSVIQLGVELRTMKTGIAKNDDIDIAYETLGDPQNETVILIAGLGSQLVYWTDELCQHFLDRDFHVVRFDNRDVGLSSKTADKISGEPPSMDEVMAGGGPIAPYTLSDMAADTISVLDALEIDAAHVVGNSLGGMIAQTVAIEYPQRTRTLTSIMSAAQPGAAIRDDTGEGEEEISEKIEGQSDEAVEKSLAMDMSDPATYVEIQVEGYRATSGPHFDAAYQRAILQRSFERCYHPAGWAYQMMAARDSGDRTAALGRLTMPALVIHGALDPLIPLAAGEATAAAIPGARLLVIDDMGHNWPRPHWSEMAEAIGQLRAVALAQ